MKTKNLLIRPAEKNDNDILSVLGRQTFSNTYAHILPENDLNDYLLREFNLNKLSKDLEDPANLFFLAFSSESICGYIKLTQSTKPKNIAGVNPIELERLYIINSYQGQGVGAALMDSGFKSAKKKGYKTCWLKVWEKNIKAIDFYKRKGFSQVGNAPFKVGTICRNIVLMSRFLT